MKLFHWPVVKALENYSCGDIIVMAEGAEIARKLAREYAETWVKDDRSWWFDHEGKLDPDEAEYYQRWITTLEEDLLKDPDIIDHPIFIRGSE